MTGTPVYPQQDRDPGADVAIVIGVGLLGIFALVAFLVSGAAIAGCNPMPRDIIWGGFVGVGGGCMVASFGVYLARHTRNWIHLISAAGATVFVIGVVGQRAYGPTQNANTALACPVPDTTVANAWSSTIQLPVLGVAVNAVAMTGLLITVIGVCGVLLFERVGEAAPGSHEVAEVFEDADTI